MSAEISKQKKVFFYFLRSRWLLWLVLVIFTVFKLPYLSAAFYWDESWPYAAAVKTMFHHGISLLPNALDPQLSRGHPLFFHATIAGWMKIFGDNNLAMHSFALFVSLCFLVSIYESIKRIFNVRAASIALIFVACNVTFFVQSSFVLPEILLSFLTLAGIFFYLKRHYLLATIFLTAMLLTKESGLVGWAVVLTDISVQFFLKKETLRNKIIGLVPVVVPILFVGIFFLLQKHYSGWYIFPFHKDSIQSNLVDVWYRFRACTIMVVFCKDLLYLIFLLLALLFSIAVVTKRILQSKIQLWLPVCLMIFYFMVFVLTDDKRYDSFVRHFPNYFAITFLAYATFYIIILWGLSRFLDHPLQRRYLLVLGMFVLAYMLFSSTVVYVGRYLISAIIPILIITAVIIDKLWELVPQWLLYTSGIAMFIILSSSFYFSTSNGDCDMGYFDALKVQTELVRYLEEHQYYDEHITSLSFLNEVHLTNPNTGFLSGTRFFTHIDQSVHDSDRLVIIDNIESDRNRDSLLIATKYQVVKKIIHGNSWVEVKERK